MKRVLTTGQVAKHTRLSTGTVYRLIARGEMPGFKLPLSNHRRVPIDELADFMRQHGMPEQWIQEMYDESRGVQPDR